MSRKQIPRKFSQITNALGRLALDLTQSTQWQTRSSPTALVGTRTERGQKAARANTAHVIPEADPNTHG